MKLVIFDVDGTLVTTKSGKTFRDTADDWQWLPRRVERIKQLRAEGVHVAIASNQGGVAFGYMKQKDILAELARMAEQVGIVPGGIYICYTHPSASVDLYKYPQDTRRKPGPGMLLEAMRDFDVLPEETLMVGDRPEDEQAAKAAGIAFQWADDYFGKITLWKIREDIGLGNHFEDFIAADSKEEARAIHAKSTTMFGAPRKRPVGFFTVTPWK